MGWETGRGATIVKPGEDGDAFGCGAGVAAQEINSAPAIKTIDITKKCITLNRFGVHMKTMLA